MEFAELLTTELIHCKVEVSSKEELLDRMALEMYDQGYVKKEYISGVLAREGTNPTGLQLEVSGCAIPHSEMSFVNKPVISIATLVDPVVFQRMDDFTAPVEVSLVFMLAVNEGLKQVNTLQELMSLLQDNVKVEELLNANTPEEILEVINKTEKVGN